MGIKERLFEHPVAFFSGCLIWLPIAIIAYALLAWMIQGDLDPLFGIFGLFVAIALGYFCMVPPRQELAPIIFGVTTLTVVGFPFVRTALNKRDLAQVDMDAMERTYEALGQRPLNPSLRYRLAKLLYSRGLVQEAVAVADRMISSLPNQFFPEEHREFQGWRSALRDRPQPTFLCLSCHYQNAAGEVFCQGCGAPYLLGRARGQWVGPKLLRQGLVVWGASLLVLIGVPVVTLEIPAPTSGLVVILLVGVATFFVAKAFAPAEVGLK